jgi:hypothetical protein
MPVAAPVPVVPSFRKPRKLGHPGGHGVWQSWASPPSSE